MFQLYANKNQLKLLEREPLTSGSVNVYEVRFEFSPDWDGLTRTAVFKAGSESRSILLDESGECVIPWEVLTKPNIALRAGVYGTKGGELVLPTVRENLGVIQDGTEPGESSQPPTPSVYEQIVDLAAKAEATAQSVREDADAGKFDGPPGPQGATGPQGPQGQQGQRGEKGDTGPQGPSGPQGEKGDVGDTGPQGLKGDTGDTGPQGIQGETGPRGEKGEKGDKGDPGPQGQRGDTGETGPQGETGNGISDISRTSGDGSAGTADTYTVTMTDGSSYSFTVYNGSDGTSFVVKGRYDTLAALQAAHPTGNAGDAWAVGTSESNRIYLWDVDAASWKDIGSLQGPAGPQGETGATPELTIGEVTTLSPGQSATAKLTGTPENPILNLGIPQGVPGEQVELDATLTKPGEAAEAKAVGDALDSPAHSINETLGPAPEVSTDVVAPGSHLQPVSEIKLVQEGEGVPSLTNIRNITGWDNITLTHNSETATQALPETVYGGRYDWEAGVLTVTHAGFNLAVADMNFSEQFPGWHIEKSVINEIVRDGFLGTVSSVVSNITKLLSINNGMQNPTIYLHPVHHGGMTQSGWKAQYPNLICQFVVPLLEPRTIQLTPREFAALSGVNILFSDCGDTSLTFTADLKEYFEKYGGDSTQGPPGPQGEKGDKGDTGEDGATFTPTVSSDGTLSWTNNGGLQNPASVNIKGPTGKDGPQGPAGKTAYQYAVDGGYTGTEAEFQTLLNDIPNKQSKLTGQPGQVVGFGADGAAAAQDGWNNTNLLDNWYFPDPINQRGKTEYIGEIYGIDRWSGKWSGYGSITLENTGTRDGCVAVFRDNNSGHIVQTVDNPQALIGKTVTASILAKNEAGGFTSIKILNNNIAIASNSGSNLEYALLSVSATIPDEITELRINIESNNAKISRLVAAKLELGSQQTLAHQDASGNWVLNDPPPDKTLELLKCQRYYQVFSSADMRPTKAVDFRPPMRIDPALSTIEIDGVTYYTADANL